MERVVGFFIDGARLGAEAASCLTAAAIGRQLFELRLVPRALSSRAARSVARRSALRAVSSAAVARPPGRQGPRRSLLLEGWQPPPPGARIDRALRRLVGTQVVQDGGDALRAGSMSSPDCSSGVSAIRRRRASARWAFEQYRRRRPSLGGCTTATRIRRGRTGHLWPGRGWEVTVVPSRIDSFDRTPPSTNTAGRKDRQRPLAEAG